MAQLTETLPYLLPLIIGFALDKIFADPTPHPIVWFGKIISGFEHRLNHAPHQITKGAFTAATLTTGILLAGIGLEWAVSYSTAAKVVVNSIVVFYCLAGTTLFREVNEVFRASAESLEAGRKQVCRIVGRDTSELTEKEVRTAALETLAENLSDGVVAPLFFYLIMGVPGMLMYKMINTLDSMIAYRTTRYEKFGKVAAKIDDAANYIPARLTAMLMLMAAGRLDLIATVMKWGKNHASPNSGYPEAALAAILDCRFGGTHRYFDREIYKPYIGNNNREINEDDARRSIRICDIAQWIAMATGTAIIYLCNGAAPML